jgi:hypothetical protein
MGDKEEIWERQEEQEADQMYWEEVLEEKNKEIERLQKANDFLVFIKHERNVVIERIPDQPEFIIDNHPGEPWKLFSPTTQWISAESFTQLIDKALENE